MANSVDPDETPHSAASHLGLPVCSGLSDRILTIYTESETTASSYLTVFSAHILFAIFVNPFQLLVQKKKKKKKKKKCGSE